MTKLESVVAQALELDEMDRELLVIQVSQSLTEDGGDDRWSDPALIAHLRRVSKHADEHPETLMEWDEAEKEIFGDPFKVMRVTSHSDRQAVSRPSHSCPSETISSVSSNHAR